MKVIVRVCELISMSRVDKAKQRRVRILRSIEVFLQKIRVKEVRKEADNFPGCRKACGAVIQVCRLGEGGSKTRFFSSSRQQKIAQRWEPYQQVLDKVSMYESFINGETAQGEGIDDGEKLEHGSVSHCVLEGGISVANGLRNVVE